MDLPWEITKPTDDASLIRNTADNLVWLCAKFLVRLILARRFELFTRWCFYQIIRKSKSSAQRAQSLPEPYTQSYRWRQHLVSGRPVWSAATRRRFRSAVCRRTRRLAAVYSQSAWKCGEVPHCGLPGSKLPGPASKRFSERRPVAALQTVLPRIESDDLPGYFVLTKASPSPSGSCTQPFVAGG